MVDAAWATSSVPSLLAGGALATLGLWLVRFPTLALVGLLAAVVVGQSVRGRLPGQGGGFLLSDLAVVLVLLAALWAWRHQHLSGVYYKLQVTSYKLRISGYALLLTAPFLLWSAFGLAVNAPALTGSHLLIAGAYWARLAAHLLLVPALLYLFSRQPRLQQRAERGLVAALAILAVVGIAQWWLVPDLAGLSAGWDPHPGRLVSSWLDPNFFGGLLAVVLPWLVARGARGGMRATLTWVQVGVWLVVLAVGVALILTKSRSSVLALGVGILATSPLWLVSFWWRHAANRRLAVGSGALLLVAFMGLGVVVLGERARGLFTYDPTVTVRLSTMAQVWGLAAEHWVVGVGYNAYQFAAQQAGLIGDFTIHSRAGADSSLLTLWVTTGVVGVLLFLVPWVAAGMILLWRWYHTLNSECLAVATGLVIWLVHSSFVNSLLYSHLIIVVAVLVTITLARVARQVTSPGRVVSGGARRSSSVGGTAGTRLEALDVTAVTGPATTLI